MVTLGSSTRSGSRRFSRSPFNLFLTSRSIRLKASWSGDLSLVADGGDKYYLRYATMGSDCLTVLMNALEIPRIATYTGCFYCYEVQILLSRRAGRDEPSRAELVRTPCHFNFSQRTQWRDVSFEHKVEFSLSLAHRIIETGSTKTEGECRYRPVGKERGR